MNLNRIDRHKAMAHLHFRRSQMQEHRPTACLDTERLASLLVGLRPCLRELKGPSSHLKHVISSGGIGVLDWPALQLVADISSTMTTACSQAS
jgi:hypothetical protein